MMTVGNLVGKYVKIVHTWGQRTDAFLDKTGVVQIDTPLADRRRFHVVKFANGQSRVFLSDSVRYL